MTFPIPTSTRPMKHSSQDPLHLRVCIVVPYDLADMAGGVKHHAVQLARMLRRQGHHVTVLGASSQKTTAPNTVGIGGIVNVPSNGSDNRMALMASAFTIRKFFRENKFDVVHIHEPPIPSISYWTAWLTPGIPKIGTFHAFGEAPPLALRLIQYVGAALQFRFLDHAIAVSNPAARFVSHTWKRPLPIVPNGIPTDLFTPTLRPAQAHSARRLLAIGRLSDQRKGIATIIEAFQRLRARNSAWTLDVVGEDVSSTRLPRMDGLTYYPPLPLKALIERYRECDIFTAPSTGQESFGIVLLEAMAIGKPIVCSDIDGYRHVADPAGAVFVPPRDPLALAEALDNLWADGLRRRAMSAFNLGYVRRFDWASVAHSVTREYLVTIENHRARHGLAPIGLLDTWQAGAPSIELLPPRRADRVGEEVSSPRNKPSAADGGERGRTPRIWSTLRRSRVRGPSSRCGSSPRCSWPAWSRFVARKMDIASSLREAVTAASRASAHGCLAAGLSFSMLALSKAGVLAHLLVAGRSNPNAGDALVHDRIHGHVPRRPDAGWRGACEFGGCEAVTAHPLAALGSDRRFREGLRRGLDGACGHATRRGSLPSQPSLSLACVWRSRSFWRSSSPW